MSALFLVATPIGNLKDITLRALEVLNTSDYIICEDTRKTGILLKHFNLKKTPLISFFESNEERKTPEILNLLNQGKNLVLVSNAGTPLISDPGYKLVRECLKQKIKIESIPGPSALLTALTLSGLPPDKFLFLGFLPKKPGKRRKILEGLKTIDENIKATIIIYLSPYKLITELNDLKNIFGDIEIVIARELTKVYQELRRETVSQAITHFETNKPKGEFVLLFRL